VPPGLLHHCYWCRYPDQAVDRPRPPAAACRLSPEAFPTLAAPAESLAGPDPDARFEFVLRVLLDGLERPADQP
jgi:hypothetical protein